MKKTLLTFYLLMMMSSVAQSSHPNGTAYVDVNGLVCDFCAQALEKVFGRRDEVESIHVDLDEKVITIHFAAGQAMDESTIAELVVDSGYDVRAIRYGG
jgi:copper chaperone CopZ